MEVVTVKFQEDILKKIDDSIKKNNFNSRTEFIREAVRDKLSELEKKQIIEHLMKLKGSAKVRMSDEEIHRVRDEVAEEFFSKVK